MGATLNPLIAAFRAQPPDAAPALGTSIAMPSAAPSMGASLPSVVAPLGTVQGDTNERARLLDSGSGVDQVKNPLLRGIARAADIAGSVFAPRIAQFIPGTTLHHQLLVGQATQNLQNDENEQKEAAALADTQSQTAQRTALAAKAQAQADNVGDDTKVKAKQVADAAKLGMVPTYDDKGNLTAFSPDENSPIAQSRALKDQLVQAQVESTNAQETEREAEAALKSAGNDPHSPAYQMALQKLQVARQNASAATTRATAYMGNYMQHAYNKGLNGETLVGAPQISNDNGQQSVVGSTNANTAIKNQSNAAQFNDVHGALDSLENAATALVKTGGRVNSPGVAAALSQPAGTLGQWLQGEGVKANLTPEERNYVTAVAAAHENVQALRKSAGGTATDSAVAKLDALIPNASTPDIDYLMRQTGQIRSTAERLGKGATTAAGGLSVRGQQGGGTIRAVDPNGVLHEAPAGTPLPAGWKAQ